MKKLLLLFSFCLLQPAFAADISDYDLGSIELKPLGNGTNIKIGRNTEIGKFQIRNRSSKKISIESITFRNYGNADLDEAVEDAGIYTTLGDKISTSSKADQKNITFLFDNGINGGFVLRGGDSIIFVIKATIAYARTNDTIQLGLRYEEDFVARDASSGFQLPVSEKLRLKSYQLESGDLSVIRSYYNSSRRYTSSRLPSWYRSYRQRSSARRSSTPPFTQSSSRIAVPISRRSYSPGARDITFLSSSVRSKTGVHAEGVTIEVSSYQVSDKNGNGISNEIEDLNETFSDFRLFVDGQMIDSTNEFENGPVLVFGNSFDLFPSSRIQVIGRITNTAQNGDKLKLRLNPKRLHDPQYLHSGDSVSPDSINGSGNGNQVESK